jgi:hypothetical protein
MTVEKGNRLKDEKANWTSKNYYRVISKYKRHPYKYMNSTPVLFTLTWHLLSRHACTPAFLRAEGTFIICHYEYNNTNKKKLVTTFKVFRLLFHILCMNPSSSFIVLMKVCPS